MGKIISRIQHKLSNNAAKGFLIDEVAANARILQATAPLVYKGILYSMHRVSIHRPRQKSS